MKTLIKSYLFVVVLLGLLVIGCRDIKYGYIPENSIPEMKFILDTTGYYEVRASVKMVGENSDTITVRFHEIYSYIMLRKKAWEHEKVGQKLYVIYSHQDGEWWMEGCKTEPFENNK